MAIHLVAASHPGHVGFRESGCMYTISGRWWGGLGARGSEGEEGGEEGEGMGAKDKTFRNTSNIEVFHTVRRWNLSYRCRYYYWTAPFGNEIVGAFYIICIFFVNLNNIIIES